MSHWPPRGIAVLVLSIFLVTTPILASARDHAPAEDPAAGTQAEPLPPVSAEGDDAADAGNEDAELDARISEKVAGAIAKQIDEEFPVKASYGSKGFRLETRDGNWQTNIQWRFQFRFTYPYRGDPRQVDDFAAPAEANFEPRRMRMKVGGHGFRPWLKYYLELDLQPSRDPDDPAPSSSTRLITWRTDLAKWKSLQLRVGQWKIEYNRERVDSSGRQQFVERSIVNRIFTIDRQMGVALRGRLFEETPADLRYFVGVFDGEGRGVNNDDVDLMYVGRLQWNFLGRELSFRQTDVERTERPTGSLAVAAATNQGVCTRWSSGACGNLDGFAKPADADHAEFDIHQAVQEAAFKWKGFSYQQEFHWKRVIDRSLASTDPTRQSDLFGLYAQTGYFFSELFHWYPEPLELAFRYAYVVEPNETDRAVDNKRQEFTAGANWFFAGHNNKITLDYSHLTLEDNVLQEYVSDNRVRVQWDVSF